MEGYFWILLIICIYVLWAIVSWVKETLSNSRKYLGLKPKLDNLEKGIKEHEWQVKRDNEIHELRVKKDNREIELKRNQWNNQVQKDKKEIQKIAAQKSMGFPWLADAYAEYFSLKDLQKEKYLKNKKHPAYTAAETVREIKKEKKILNQQNKIIKYKIKYYEKLFPWLCDLIAEDEDDEIPVKMNDGDLCEEDNEDRVKDWLTQEEYQALPSVERNQKALNRYLRSRCKSKWHIGRDYEMYVGYLLDSHKFLLPFSVIGRRFLLAVSC